MSIVNYNPFKVLQQQITDAARILNLDEATTEFLLWPQRELKVTFPVRLVNGEVKVFHGYRVHYNTARGPAKGGIRFHPDETIDTIRALAGWMVWKTALLDLPLGGAKGGVICNPRALSERDLENIARAYTRAVFQFLGVDRDVPAPDVYTNPQTMAWMMDEYESIAQMHQPGVFTDKPQQIGGTEGRRDATARGGVFAVREACMQFNVEPHGTFAIQGFGNAGQRAALLHASILGGGKLVAVCDSRGGIYNPEGFDPEDLVTFKLKTGSVVGYPHGQAIPRDSVLELDVDILYPAALENAINSENAHKVQAKIICELANGPTTPDADLILHKRGIHVIPDILASAGGVTVSYFEMVQNRSMYFWDEQTVYARLEERITKAYRNMIEAMGEKNIHPRLAAMVVAVARVAQACQLRGWV